MTSTVLDQKQLKRRYQEAVQFLDDNYAYFLTHVLHIGRPMWNEAVGTAAVMMQKNENTNKTDYDFNFLFAPSFASKLDTPALAFILAHEAYHIILNHLKLYSKFVDNDRVNALQKKREKGEKLTKKEWKEIIVNRQNSQRFNIAADCVINDSLVNAGMDDSAFYNNPGSPMYTDQAPEGVATLCRGQEKVGEDASLLTVTDVYELLMQQNKKQDQDDQQSEEGGEDRPSRDGIPGDGDMDGRGYQALDNHDWMLDPEFADEMADAIDKLQQEIEDAGKMPQDVQDKIEEEDGGQTKAQQQLANSMRAGSEAGNMKAFMGQTGAKLGWVKLLKEIDPDIFKEPGIGKPPVAQWHKRPRKLAGMRKVHLPVREKAHREKESREKPAIVLALDVSGSIGPKDADRFIELAKSIPGERIKLFCATFDTQYVKINDIHTETNFRIGGGTDFTAVANYVNNEVIPELKGKYPKAIVVITDGQAGMNNRPDAKQGESWFWLISPADRADHSYCDPSLTIGRRDKLENYVV